MAKAKTPTSHLWFTPQEYADQLAMPVHMLADPKAVHDLPDGSWRLAHATVCGLLLGSELMRTTDDPEDVTCETCLAAAKK